MRDYICEYETHLQENRKSSNNTIVSYVRDISQFNEFIYALGVKNVADTSEADLANYINYLHECGKSRSTVTRVIASLRGFFTYLQSLKIISTNPTKNLKSEKKEKKLPKILTSNEVEVFLNQPKCDSLKGYRDKAMLELLYATGIRVSELIALDINDVNVDLGFIRCGQGSSERVIPLYSTAISAINNYLTSSRPLLIANRAEKSLFVNVNGSRMTRQGFWKIIKHYQKTANISIDITPHILRHSFAAHLLQNGADIADIKEMMGHSDIASTMIYAQLIKNNLKASYIKYHPRA